MFSQNLFGTIVGELLKIINKLIIIRNTSIKNNSFTKMMYYCNNIIIYSNK